MLCSLKKKNFQQMTGYAWEETQGFEFQAGADQTSHMDIKYMDVCGTHSAVGVLFSVTHTIFAC